MDGMTEEQRAAFMRFVDFESKRIEEKDDTTLMVLYAALRRLEMRAPERMRRVLVMVTAFVAEEVVKGSP